MQSSATIVYDSGRFRLWARIPALAVGLFMFYCTISILADSFLGLDIGLGIAHTASPGAHTLAGVARLIGHTLLASSITALIGAAWMIIWFAQGPE